MKAKILTIGTELTRGGLENTNSIYLARKLTEMGLIVSQIITVPDNKKALEIAFRQAAADAKIVIATGGLGATDNDITKEGFCAAFNERLLLYRNLLEEIKEKLKKRESPFTSLYEKQAYLPENAKVLRNPLGLAFGWAYYTRKTQLYILPGLPMEMQYIFETSVQPEILSMPRTIKELTRVVRTIGVPEAFIQENIGKEKLTNEFVNIRLQAHFAGVDVAVTLTGKPSEQLAEPMELIVRKLQSILGINIYGYNNDTLHGVLGKALIEKNLTLSVAESFTGGKVMDLITDIPGSSEYFMEGKVTYSNAAKISELGVDEDTIKRYGAVSADVAKDMADGIRKRSGTDIGISTTGIAGPTGATPMKPVGLVFVGYSDERGNDAVKYILSGDRNAVKTKGAYLALDIARRHIIGKK